MEVPRSVIDGYDETVSTAIAAIQNELRASLSLIDYSAPVEQIRTEVVSLMDAYCGAASDVGARLSSEFYNGLRQMVTGKATALSLQSGRNPRATERAVRAFVQQLVDGGEDASADFEELLLARVEYEAKRAIAHNTIDNVRRDPDQPRFARVPQGERTCDFCLMLASRGPVYLTEESAGAFTKYHAHCDCKVVPFWDTVADGASRRRSISMSVEGYDPDALYERYQDLMKDPKSTFADRMARGAETAKQRHGSTSGGRATKESNERVSHRIVDIEKAKSMSELRRIVDSTSVDGLTDKQVTGLQNAVIRARKRLESEGETARVPSGSSFTRVRMRTGRMSSGEYAEYRRELDAVRHRKQIWLPSDEYAHVMSEINTHLSDEDRKHALVTKAIGSYRYTFINRGFDDYIIVGRTQIR